MTLKVSLVLGIILFAFCFADVHKKAVSVSLHAKWPQTSFLAETSEFMAKDNKRLFWDFIEQIVENIKLDEWNTYSDAKQHDVAVRLASKLLEPSRTKLLKFALSLRAHSPTVQLFQQLGMERANVNCTAFAEIQGTITCDENDLEELLRADNENNSSMTTYSVDHIYPISTNHEKAIFVYGELGTQKWLNFHKVAQNLAKKNQAKYVFRHWVKDSREDNVLLSGYDVELAIKSTEYKAVDDSQFANRSVIDEENDEDAVEFEDIHGFNFNVLRKLHPDQKESLNQFRLHLLERDELTPLKVWQVQDLSFQAAQRIMAAGPASALNSLLEISQNFPLLARPISRQIVKESFRQEVAENQEHHLSNIDLTEGDSGLWINGINIDLESIDVYNLLDTLKSEEELARGFYKLGFKENYSTLLMNIAFHADESFYALDFREANPEYLNNLNTDRQYRDWGNSVTLLLQPYFPGMIRPIARNLFNIILLIDPSHVGSYHLLKTILAYRKHNIPMRYGVVFVVNDDESASGFEDASIALFNLYHFLKSEEGIIKAMESLLKISNSVADRDFLTSNDVLSYLKEYYSDIDANDILGHDSVHNSGRSVGKLFVTRKGLDSVPKVLLNGVVLENNGITPERFEETLTSEVMKITSRLQKAVLTKKLTDKDNVVNWMMSQPEIMPRINKRILGSVSTKATYLNLFNRKICTAKLSDFQKLPQSEHNQCMMQRMRYLTRTDESLLRPVTVWIIADLEDADGRSLVYNAIKQLKHSHTMRIGIINNPKDTEAVTKSGSISMLVNAAMRLLPPGQKKSFVTKLVKEEFAVKLQENTITLEEIAVNGMDVATFRKELKQLSSDEIIADKKFIQRATDFKAGEFGVIVNGLLIGPLYNEELLKTDDFELIDKYMTFLGTAKIAEHVERFTLGRDEVESSDIIAGTLSLISMHSSKQKRFTFPNVLEAESVLNIPADDAKAESLQVISVVDPLSKTAQRLSTFLLVLQKVTNVDIKLVMNPKGKLSELPLKRFYRMVLEPEVPFDDSGSLSSSHYEARFTSLPSKQLLTLNVVPPDSWIVQGVHAVYDLDNIKMEDVVGNVIAKFELENILLEGQCFDDASGIPPRGLQFTLGTRKNSLQFDTIVMANLGYFQLKANPGAWILRLRAGKSKDIYEIANYVNVESEDYEDGLNVLIDSFTGRTIRVRVTKRSGMEDENLLMEGKGSDEEIDQPSSIWNTISSSITGGESYDSINIFSVASGHLYERFLRIMILSVMKNTKHPVKFWLLKNYLSPNFKETLPIMANHYGFQYELVEYKWPRWLHRQTEKQRVMWGFKILFLDVLFPLNLHKIIFVDADQIVRTDLMELMKLDLGGAPYGFTPFCDSRKSMDGFRFWKQGYWANHLAGRKYHISALYVIDLVKFRQIAAGDRLRGQYHGLSADPNSLSNLDQDLPNNMIHQVRIKSLPQEWLWCETWCDDASKAKAKTIDLCNNPQTKEPKLNSAIRIIPEWKEYDAEIKNILSNITQTTKKSKDEKHEEL